MSAVRQKNVGICGFVSHLEGLGVEDRHEIPDLSDTEAWVHDLPLTTVVFSFGNEDPCPCTPCQRGLNMTKDQGHTVAQDGGQAPAHALRFGVVVCVVQDVRHSSSVANVQSTLLRIGHAVSYPS